MQLRAQTAADHAAIGGVIDAAFALAQHRGGNEARIVAALRASGALTLSWVAEVEGEVVGHVAVSPVTISDSTADWYGLGPVAVLPAFQRQGIADALIRTVLAQLAARSAAGCVVLGDPAYYTRFGFAPHAPLFYPDVPPEYFMALPLTGPLPAGRVQYADAFAVP